MPLLALVGQFTSMCNLKSWNFCLVAILEPADSFTREACFTTQLEDLAGLSKVHPEKSRRLNRRMVLPHFTSAGGLRAGAGLPVQVQGSPFGPRAEPDRVWPVSLPSNTRSFVLPSSCLGETN